MSGVFFICRSVVITSCCRAATASPTTGSAAAETSSTEHVGISKPGPIVALNVAEINAMLKLHSESPTAAQAQSAPTQLPITLCAVALILACLLCPQARML